VTAICAVLVPVAAGVALGEPVATAAWAGIAVALAAVWLVGQDASPRSPRAASPTGLRLALASGAMIGLFLVALERTSAAAGLWPLAVARAVSVSLFVAVAIATRQPLGVPREVLALALACGALDMSANALYVLAVQQGALGVVATLVSLYPASTVLLARLVLGERLTWLQTAGVACALLAVVLLVGGSA
jgi:drug/metabolite transporter (DMT)-like permease